jgi:hypothetical protein
MPKLIASPLSEYPNPTFANDLLGRQGFGERLLGLVKSASAGAVLALDAPWGEGKTTFVRMWKNLLEEKGYSAVYLDAFEQDHQEDPFLPLVASILDAASAKVEDQATLASKIDSLRKKAGQVGVRFSGWLTRLAVRSATLGIIRDTDLEALDDIRTELAGDVSKAVEVAIESRLSTFKAEKNALQEFRLELEALAKAISSSSGGPLVVIVDELDRCRPSFALNLIERIKHVLDVPGVMFLFVLNRPQLEESVRSVYGPGIDAPGYVAKFVHVWCSLPKRGRRGHDTDYQRYCSALYDAHDLTVWEDAHVLKETMPELSSLFELTLREMERLFTNIAVFYATARQSQLRMPGFAVALAIIRMRYPEVYRKLRDRSLSFSEFDAAVPELQAPSDDDPAEYAREVFMYCLMTNEELNSLPDTSRVPRYRETFFRYNLRDRSSIIPHICGIFDMFHVE